MQVKYSLDKVVFSFHTNSLLKEISVSLAAKFSTILYVPLYDCVRTEAFFAKKNYLKKKKPPAVAINNESGESENNCRSNSKQ